MGFLQRSKGDAFSQKWKEWIAFMCHGPGSSAQCFVFFIQLLFLLDITDWLCNGFNVQYKATNDSRKMQKGLVS